MLAAPPARITQCRDVNYPANAGTRRRPSNYPLRDRVYWGDGIMLQNLSSNVRECLQRAKECAERAKLEPNPALQRDFIDMEARWLKLARSYQFAEQLQTFTSHNGGQRTLLSERLERLRRYLANKSAPP